VGPDQRRHLAPVTFDTRKDAESWLAAVQTDIARGDWHRPVTHPAMDLFESYARSWLATRQLTPRTRSEYRKLIDGHLIPAFGSLRLDEITPVMVRDWYATLSTTTGPTRRARAYALLRTILGTAVTDDLIAASPCRIRGAGQTKRARTIRPATLEQLGVIAETIRPEYSAAVLLAAWCGLRFGEVAELRRRDVDPGKGMLRIRRAVTHVDGQPIVGPPKSQAGIRDVAIPPHLRPALVAHLRTHTALGRDALLFPAPTGGQLRSDGALHESFHAARTAAGRPDLRFHDLRHTGATLAAGAGASLAELMRRLGHSTSAAALAYQHGTDERDQLIAAALSGFATAGVVQLHPRQRAHA
jgi:integrase